MAHFCPCCSSPVPEWVPAEQFYQGHLSDFSPMRFCSKFCKMQWMAEWKVLQAKAEARALGVVGV